MKIIKKIALGLLAVFSAIISFFSVFAMIFIEVKADFEQGRMVVLILFLTISAFFCFVTIKCCQAIFHRGERQIPPIDANATCQGETNLDSIEHLEQDIYIENPIVNKLIQEEKSNNKPDNTLLNETDQHLENDKIKTDVISVNNISTDVECCKYDDGGYHKEDLSVNEEEYSDDQADEVLIEEVQQLDNNGVEPVFEDMENVFTYRKFPKCNCDGCHKQGNCQYGHVIYDEFTGERMSLFDKFMMLNVCETDFPEASIVVATNEELHDMSLLMKLDKEALYETLEYLQNIKKWYYDYGKCGKAYFNFMKMGDEILLVKETIREYDEYHNMLSSIELLKKTIMYKVEKEQAFRQDKLYEEFDGIQRKWITTAVRQLEKEKLIVREKTGKTYIIRKNKINGE